ncbi:hypothetical protein [Flavobacterium sp.]|uniref:hypothetical protein n=1 Tax=Flavobacterium sp. TaxID=239 RepID=UPI0037C0A830
MEFMSLKCGSDVIVFNKDKQEIARGVAISSCDGDIGVMLKSGKLYDELMKHPELLIQVSLRYTYLHFTEMTGMFIGFNFSDQLSDEVEQLLDGIRAVNVFEFGFGICNKVFADYPGFRATVNSD